MKIQVFLGFPVDLLLCRICVCVCVCVHVSFIGPQWTAKACKKGLKRTGIDHITSDCYLRQGAGGTEFARNGSRTLFLR